MNTIEIDVVRLKADYPKRFAKEVEKWAEYAWEPCYAEHIIDDLCAMAQDLGFSIESNEVQWSLSYSQGDGVSFSAGVHLADWMKAKGYDEQYPALWATANVGNDALSVEPEHHRSHSMRVNNYLDFFGAMPAGVFEGLDPEVFEEIVQEQYEELDPAPKIKKDCDSLAHEAYKSIVAEYECQTGADRFVEWALDHDVFFEVDPDSEV